MKVFEMINTQLESDVDPRLEQKERRRTANRNRKPAAFAVAAVIGLVAAACTPGTQGRTRRRLPTSHRRLKMRSARSG
jgi:hypothetical protein